MEKKKLYIAMRGRENYYERKRKHCFV